MAVASLKVLLLTSVPSRLTYWRKLEKTIPSGFPLLTNFRKSRSLTGICGGSNQESNFQTTKKGWLNDSCCGAKRCW